MIDTKLYMAATLFNWGHYGTRSYTHKQIFTGENINPLNIKSDNHHSKTQLHILLLVKQITLNIMFMVLCHRTDINYCTMHASVSSKYFGVYSTSHFSLVIY